MLHTSIKGAGKRYNVVVIGSGLGGLTSANRLARSGHTVLLLEHHHQLGGLATWFKRKGLAQDGLNWFASVLPYHEDESRQRNFSLSIGQMMYTPKDWYWIVAGDDKEIRALQR